MTKFAILGCGVIGPVHARAISRLSDAELVAVADRSLDCVEKLAAEHGARVYTDLQEMLDREDLDIVNVCTPSGMHAEHACQVMRSGRHVIVEKPLDIDLAAID